MTRIGSLIAPHVAAQDTGELALVAHERREPLRHLAVIWIEERLETSVDPSAEGLDRGVRERGGRLLLD